MAEVNTHSELTETPRKRPIKGSKKEHEKKARLSSHIEGESCHCTRLRCFETLSAAARQSQLERFNSLNNKNEQDAMLSAIITPMIVQRRRPRKEEDQSDLHSYSYQYHLLIADEAGTSKRQICFKAFLSIFGISKSRVERLQKALTSTGMPPKDGRGKHSNRPRAFNKSKVDSIINRIRSFKGRQSHYTLRDSKRLYLPEDLNLAKMHDMYLESHPGEPCCRESYRRVFVEKFNVSFGYPRKDKCSTCDNFKVEFSKDHPAEELRKLCDEYQLHLRKAGVFYQRKTAALQEAQSSDVKAAACFDFWKNLPTPNITTNDVYYRRQLSSYTFNIHNLGTGDVHLFTYDETIGKKGSNEVASMLRHYFTNVLPQRITSLDLFCDSCPGQNKKWTMLRFLHYLVHKSKRFERIKLSFPIRGHSYMECDRDMALIQQSSPVFTPDGWQDHFRCARKNPSPFNVVSVEQNLLLDIDRHIGNFFLRAAALSKPSL